VLLGITVRVAPLVYVGVSEIDLWDVLTRSPRTRGTTEVAMPQARSCDASYGYGRFVGWAATARRVRDSGLPMGRRVTALHSLVANHHAPLGFAGTRRRLRKLAGVGLFRRWTQPRLLLALRALEESRSSHLEYLAVFAQRRRREKAVGRRQPTKGDVAALRRPEWLKNVDEAGRRYPESICRVCGYDDVGEERWTGPDGAQYVICPCCGAESGVDDDYRASALAYRRSWISRGCQWVQPEESPPDWALNPQAAQIPGDWR
jgi:hypothetical protein